MANYHLTARLKYDINAWNGKTPKQENFENSLPEGKDNEPCHLDKSYSGNTENVFANNTNKNKKQYYHGGCQEPYDASRIKIDKSYTLFYSFLNDTRTVVGLGCIQKKGSIFETSDNGRKGKIYCYEHNKDEKESFSLFRYPFQELDEIKFLLENGLDFSITPDKIKNCITKKDKEYLTGECTIWKKNKYHLSTKNCCMHLKENTESFFTLFEERIKSKIDDINKKDHSPNALFYFLKELIEEYTIHYESHKVFKPPESEDLSVPKVPDDFEVPDDERLFFKFQSHLAPTSLVYKYTQSLYEQIMLLKNNSTLWDAILAISQVNGWNFSDESAIKFLREAKLKLNSNLKDMKNPGLWGLCDYLEIEPDPELLDMCEELEPFNVQQLHSDSCDKYPAHKLVLDYLPYYPIGKDVIERVFQTFDVEVSINTNNKKSIYAIANDVESLKLILDNPYLLFEDYIQSDDAPLRLEEIDWGEKTRHKSLNPPSEFNTDNPYRLRAIIVDFIHKQEKQTGHVWMSLEDAQNYLIETLIQLDGTCKNIPDIKKLIGTEKFKEKFVRDETKPYMTTKNLKEKEKTVSTTLKNLMQDCNNHWKFFDPEPTEYVEQKIALEKMKTLNFVFVSGVAGSGKSHTLCSYLDFICEDESEPNVQVLVPTGKAGNVLKEKLKDKEEDKEEDKEIFPNAKQYFYGNVDKISTAHAFLTKLKWWNSKLQTFIKPKNYQRIALDILIIDEISMITLDMMDHILQAIEPKKLIILGDIKQLPPIGYGSLATSIYTFLDQQGHHSLAKMETSHRAGPGAKFIDLSLKLRNPKAQLTTDDLTTDEDNGLHVKTYEDSNELNNEIKVILNSVMEKDKVADSLVELAKNLNSFQILCPSQLNDYGTIAINTFLVEQLDSEVSNAKFIKLKNDNKTGIVNGMFGVKNGSDEIKFENGESEKFSKEKLNSEYTYGYAITIHKSQGSGFNTVVLVIPPEYSPLMTKQLIYTALTRPSKTLYILMHKEHQDLLTQLSPQGDRNMNIFQSDRALWKKTAFSSRFAIDYNGTSYLRKQDLYVALLEKNVKTEVKYDPMGSFEFDDKLLNIKHYMQIKAEQFGKTGIVEEVKSIDLSSLIRAFRFTGFTSRLGEVATDYMQEKEYKPNDRVKIITHNQLVTRSWSEAIIMLILDQLDIHYDYESKVFINKDKQDNDGNDTFHIKNATEEGIPKLLPDFTLTSSGIDPIFYEHLGMLDNENYTNHWKKKIEIYESIGYTVITLKSFDQPDALTINGEEIDLQNINKLCITTDEEDFKDVKKLKDIFKKFKAFYKLKNI